MIGLPDRLFYSLEEAVIELSKNEETKCTISDLLHFAAIGAFEPLVFIDGRWESTGTFTDDAFSMEYYIPMDNSNDNSTIEIIGRDLEEDLFESDLCEINIYKIMFENDIEDNEDFYPFDSYEISVTGFMAFKPITRRLGFF